MWKAMKTVNVEFGEYLSSSDSYWKLGSYFRFILEKSYHVFSLVSRRQIVGQSLKMTLGSSFNFNFFREITSIDSRQRYFFKICLRAI